MAELDIDGNREKVGSFLLMQVKIGKYLPKEYFGQEAALSPGARYQFSVTASYKVRLMN